MICGFRLTSLVSIIANRPFSDFRFRIDILAYPPPMSKSTYQDKRCIRKSGNDVCFLDQGERLLLAFQAADAHATGADMRAEDRANVADNNRLRGTQRLE